MDINSAFEKLVIPQPKEPADAPMSDREFAEMQTKVEAAIVQLQERREAEVRIQCATKDHAYRLADAFRNAGWNARVGAISTELTVTHPNRR